MFWCYEQSRIRRAGTFCESVPEPYTGSYDDIHVILAFVSQNNARFKTHQRMALLRNVGGIFACCLDHQGSRMKRRRFRQATCSMNGCTACAAYVCSLDGDADRCAFRLCETCHLTVASEQSMDALDGSPDHSNDAGALVMHRGTAVRGAVFWNSFGKVLSRSTSLHAKAMESIGTILSRAQGLSSTLFPEALMFPQIFWHQEASGAFTGRQMSFRFWSTYFAGALPLNLLAHSSGTKIGLDSLSNHVWSRLCSSFAFTSTDPDYRGYCFDLVFNAIFKNRDSRFIFSRGAEAILDPLGDGITDDFLNTSGFASTQARELPFSEYDATRSVSELCAAARQHGLTHFLTVSCNQASFPGVRIWHKLITEVGLQREPFLVDLCRIWERSSRLLLEWIERGEEKPIGGRVLNIWARYEFQTVEAHPPHLHAFLTVEGNPDNYLRSTTSSIAQLHEVLSRQSWLSHEEVLDITSWAGVVQAHDCAKARGRCSFVESADGSKRCKVAVRPVLETHDFEVLVPHYDKEFTSLLTELGIAQRDGAGEIVLDPVLLDGKWSYPTDGNTSRKISSFSPLLFVAVGGSHVNLQLTGGYHGVVSYATKYAAGEEERAIVTHCTSQSSGGLVPKTRLEVGDIINTKINHLDADYRTKFRSRFISEPEMVWFSIGLPYVVSTFKMIHIDCRPADMRPQKLRRDRGSNRPEGGCEELEATLTEIQDAIIPESRAAQPSQIRRLADLVCSGYAADRVALFDLRPPELFALFDNVTEFHKFCVVIKKGVSKLSFKDRAQLDLTDVGFYTISGYKVLLREEFLRQVVFLRGWHAVHDDVRHILLLLLNAQDRKSEFYIRFVSRLFKKRKCSVFVQTMTRPMQRTLFLQHFLLRHGRYESELSLFYEGDCRTLGALFAKAELLSAGPGRNSVLNLLRTYFFEVITETCASSKEIQTLMLSAEECFESLFQANIAPQQNLPAPPVLQTDFESSIFESFKSMQREMFQHLIRGITEEIPGFPGPRILEDFERDYDSRIRLPSPSERIGHSAVLGSGEWFPPAVGPATPENVVENIHARNRMLQMIHDRIRREEPFYLYIGGEPGTGKTYTMQEIAGVLISQGFRNVVLTTTSAQRALDKGGVHLAELFGFTVYPSFDHENPMKVAYNALRTLQKHPCRLLRLCQLELLLWEEVGLESNRKLRAVNAVLQKLRCSSQPFGGVSVIASGHHMQLPSSAKGMQLFESPHFLYTFEVVLLRRMIRLRVPEHQQIVDDLCKPYIAIDEARELSHRIMATIKHVNHWSDVPLDAVVVFGIKEAVASATASMLKRREEAGVLIFRHRCTDEKKLPHGFATTADRSHCSALSKKLKEPELLEIFVGCPVMMTRNHVIPGIFHGARGMVTEVDVTVNGIAAITVCWARRNQNDLVTVVRPVYSCDVCPKPRLTLRRYQFPLRTVFAQTYHSIQGAQFPAVATTLTTTGRRRMWMRQQLIVLLSRVGDMGAEVYNVMEGVCRDQMQRELADLIAKRTQWLENVDHVLEERNLLRDPRPRNQVFNQAYGSYQEEAEVALPFEKVLGVYMIASTFGHIYIGFSTDVTNRVNQHKQAIGAVELRPRQGLRVLALVTHISEVEAKQLEIWAQRNIGRRPNSHRRAINDLCDYVEAHLQGARVDHV